MIYSFQLTQLKAEHASQVAGCKAAFNAMASPCEVLFDSDDLTQALELGLLAQQEAQRIEHKFSRYRDDNLVYAINHSQGQAISLDQETADLMDFCYQIYELSAGCFDISSGLLRKAWHFDGSDNIPTKAQVEKLLPKVGLDKVVWHAPFFSLPTGMEIDLGGIGKEYAVDKVFKLIQQRYKGAFLVNFGGDIRVQGPRSDGSAWTVGIEGAKDKTTAKLISGGLATSGDTKRFLLKDGIRYSHILNPKTGYPVEGAPQSITTIAATCIQAGILSSLALMKGAGAEEFLQQQSIQHWSIR